MSVIVVFVIVVVTFSGWWLARQKILSKPWLEPGVAGSWGETKATSMPNAKLGLAVFLAVVGSLFGLFASAYFMRMELSDWQTPPLPRLLWFNTAVLILCSVLLQGAVLAARRSWTNATRFALIAGGLTTLIFLAGQLVAWREMAASGYFLQANPANSFFYLLTGMHGLHILGGLVALARTTIRAWVTDRASRLQLSVELCAMYWHFLLFIWLALFALLAGWGAEFIQSLNPPRHS
jgi:cytochrome c oxidase subunit 3